MSDSDRAHGEPCTVEEIRARFSDCSPCTVAEANAMQLTLTVIEGPSTGQVFTFTGHDTFLVGRSPRAHFRLKPEPGAGKDLYVSRMHFLVEVNPPLCRLLDLRAGPRLPGIAAQRTRKPQWHLCQWH
jgi:hypothetical protein